MKKHRHKFKKTGKARYSCPVDVEYKCECGEIKWVSGPPIPVIKLTSEEFKKRYPHFSFDPNV